MSISRNSNDKQEFEEITFGSGKEKNVQYLAIGWTVPLQASKEYWIKKYDLDPTQAIAKKTVIKD